MSRKLSHFRTRKNSHNQTQKKNYNYVITPFAAFNQSVIHSIGMPIVDSIRFDSSIPLHELCLGGRPPPTLFIGRTLSAPLHSPLPLCASAIPSNVSFIIYSIKSEEKKTESQKN